MSDLANAISGAFHQKQTRLEQKSPHWTVKARSHGAAMVAATATLTIGFHSVWQQITYYVMCHCRCHTEWVLNLFTCGTIAAAAAVWTSPLVTMESNCYRNIFSPLSQALSHRVNGPLGLIHTERHHWCIDASISIGVITRWELNWNKSTSAQGLRWHSVWIRFMVHSHLRFSQLLREP